MTKCFHKRKHKVENYKGVETEGDVIKDRERQEEEERREELEEEVAAHSALGSPQFRFFLMS